MKPLVQILTPLLAALSLMMPVLAQTPTAVTTASTAAPVLDSLIGKRQIVGITKKDKTRFLGRVLSGDHGMYIVQTFHFAGPPHVTEETTVTEGTPRLTGRGANRHYTTPKPTRHTTKTSEGTVIPDDQAVGLLLKGVAGSNVNPGESLGTRELISASDVTYIQALSPPKTAAATVPKPSLPSTPGTASPVSASPTAWTLTTLWPLKNASK